MKLWTNNATSLLADDIEAADTEIPLATGDGARFPNPTGGNFFWAAIWEVGSLPEIVKCTHRSGDTLTVVRGQQGTAAVDFAADSPIALQLGIPDAPALQSDLDSLVIPTLLEGWYAENVTAELTAVLGRFGGGTAIPAGALILRAGSITGIAVYSNAAITAGMLTASVFKNGETTGFSTVLDDGNTPFAHATQPKLVDVFAPGDILEISITTDAEWLPVTADIRGVIEIAL